MNTKVRGDKIKEGSIPLSALNYSQIAFIPYCDNTWEMNLTHEYQVFPTDEIWYEDGYIYGKPVISVYDELIFIKCENIEENKEYVYKHSNMGIAFYIKVENGIVKIKGDYFVIDDLLGLVYVGIYPKNIKASPDWNAQEGEAGYIKNKPFGEKKYEKLEWQYRDDYGCLIAQSQTNKIFINGVEYTLDYQDVTPIYVNGTNYGFLAYDNFIAAFGSDDSVIDTLTNNVFILVDAVIDEKYLPDTVLKTTPQPLSNADKNQALVNLGIDLIDFTKGAKIVIDFSKPGEYTFEEYGINITTSNGIFLRAITLYLSGETELETILVDIRNVPNYDNDYSNTYSPIYIDHVYTQYTEDSEKDFGYSINVLNKTISIWGV